MRCVLALLLLGLLCVQIRAQAFLNNQPISLPGLIEVEVRLHPSIITPQTSPYLCYLLEL